MMSLKKIFILLGLSCTTQISLCQNAINVTSRTATINDIVHDYSIGEMGMIATERNGNLIITQGVIQPINSSLKIKDGDIKTDLIDFVKVYPNPTKNLLSIELIETENITIQLFDALGKLILEMKNRTQKTTLDMNSYSIGNYYLVAFNSKDQTQKLSFKIQKIK
jgi:hypothetical protein